jgi:hypothetical protein
MEAIESNRAEEGVLELDVNVRQKGADEVGKILP